MFWEWDPGVGVEGILFWAKGSGVRVWGKVLEV